MIMRDAVVEGSGNFDHMARVFSRAPKSRCTGLKHFGLHRICSRRGEDSIPRASGQQSSAITSRPPWRGKCVSASRVYVGMCMRVCIVSACMCVRICIAYLCACICMCVRVCNACVYACVCKYVRVCSHVHARVYARVYVCAYLYRV